MRAAGRRIQTTPNTLTTHGLSLRACIAWAYGMPAQIIGPDWLDEVRLDILAKADKPVGDTQLYLMLRTLLIERMSLKTQGFDRPVIDATGLTGRYDIRFDIAAAARAASQADPPDPAGTMMAALEEQMGLKVVSRKAPVDVLVIDHSEKRPREN